MINRFNDLSANERTYLAWLRTSLSLVAFGFVLERFDLFLRTFAQSLSKEKLNILSPVGREAGIILVALGFLAMILATWRFVATTRQLQTEKIEAYSMKGTLILGALFLLIALFILLYVTRILSAT